MNRLLLSFVFLLAVTVSYAFKPALLQACPQPTATVEHPAHLLPEAYRHPVAHPAHLLACPQPTATVAHPAHLLTEAYRHPVAHPAYLLSEAYRHPVAHPAHLLTEVPQQTVDVSYVYDEGTGAHIVSLPESLPHDYMLQKVVYDLQFQMTRAGRLFLSVNIGQTGHDSQSTKLAGMYRKPLQSAVQLLLQNKEWVSVRSAIVKGEKLVMENGDTLAMLSLLLPLDSFTSSTQTLQGKTPDNISSYMIDRLLKYNIQKLVFSNEDFHMNYLNTSLYFSPLLVALSQHTDIKLPEDIGVRPAESHSSHTRRVSTTVNNYNQYRSLQEMIQKTGRCRLATLTTNYGGSMVYGPNGYFSSGRMPSDLSTYLKLINRSKKKIEEINIAENGAFVVVYDYYDFFHQGLPDKMVEALSNVGKQDLVYSACFNLKGEWAVVTKKRCYASKEIQKHLDSAKEQYGKPRHCFFTENGISIICARGIYTHNVPQKLLDALDAISWKPTAVKFTDSGYFIISNDSEKCYYNL